MNSVRHSLVLILMVFFLTACGSDGLYRFTLVTDREHVFNHDLAGDLILLDGLATLAAGKTLDGSAHVLSGNLNVDGEITGNISFLNGNLTLGPTARIRGDLNLGSGSYHASPVAVIEGRINKGSGIPLPDLPEQRSPAVWEIFLQTLFAGSLLGLLGVAGMRYMPDAVDRVGNAAVQHSLVSGAIGLLVGIVGISLLVTMAYTILLIPVTLLGMIVLGIATIYGWIGLGVSMGRFGVRILKRSIGTSYSAFFGILLFMFLMELVTSIPMIGGLIGIIIAVIGLGAVTLTRFGLQSFTRTG